jgi:hypothetical protein
VGGLWSDVVALSHCLSVDNWMERQIVNHSRCNGSSPGFDATSHPV